MLPWKRRKQDFASAGRTQARKAGGKKKSWSRGRGAPTSSPILGNTAGTPRAGGRSEKRGRFSPHVPRLRRLLSLLLRHRVWWERLRVIPALPSSEEGKKGELSVQIGWGLQRNPNNVISIFRIFFLPKSWFCLLFWRLKFQAPYGSKKAQQSSFYILTSFIHSGKSKSISPYLKLSLKLRHVFSDQCDMGQELILRSVNMFRGLESLG